MLAEVVDMKEAVKEEMERRYPNTVGRGEKEQRTVTSRYFYICSGKHHGTDHLY